jgi:undecaprenyl-diphosphatase
VAAGALLAPAVATALFVLLKQVFARARPAVAGHFVPSTYAFPSGHATASTAVCCTLAYVYWREGFISRRFGVCLATIPPFLIGLSRVYLDVHWTTDVLGGWSLGLLIAVLGAALYDRNRRREAAAASLEGHASTEASSARQNV